MKKTLSFFAVSFLFIHPSFGADLLTPKEITSRLKQLPRVLQKEITTLQKEEKLKFEIIDRDKEIRNVISAHFNLLDLSLGPAIKRLAGMADADVERLIISRLGEILAKSVESKLTDSTYREVVRVTDAKDTKVLLDYFATKTEAKANFKDVVIVLVSGDAKVIGHVLTSHTRELFFDLSFAASFESPKMGEPVPLDIPFKVRVTGLKPIIEKAFTYSFGTTTPIFIHQAIYNQGGAVYHAATAKQLQIIADFQLHPEMFEPELRDAEAKRLEADKKTTAEGMSELVRLRQTAAYADELTAVLHHVGAKYPDADGAELLEYAQKEYVKHHAQRVERVKLVSRRVLEVRSDRAMFEVLLTSGACKTLDECFEIYLTDSLKLRESFDKVPADQKGPFNLLPLLNVERQHFQKVFDEAVKNTAARPKVN